MSFKCQSCGALWPDEHVRDWGTTEESDGYGPEPRCVALVENARAPRAEVREGGRSNGRVIAEEVPMQVCGGRLNASTASADIREVRKINPNRPR